MRASLPGQRGRASRSPAADTRSFFLRWGSTALSLSPSSFPDFYRHVCLYPKPRCSSCVLQRKLQLGIKMLPYSSLLVSCRVKPPNLPLSIRNSNKLLGAIFGSMPPQHQHAGLLPLHSIHPKTSFLMQSLHLLISLRVKHMLCPLETACQACICSEAPALPPTHRR